MAIKDTVCGVAGHRIASLPAKQTPIPSTSIIVTAYELVCTQCGRTLEEIRKERQTAPRERKPKSKPVTSEVPSIPAPLEA